jgi:hypothetical protein
VCTKKAWLAMRCNEHLAFFSKNMKAKTIFLIHCFEMKKKHSIAYVNKWKPKNGSCKNEEEFDNVFWWNICKSKNWGE